MSYQETALDRILILSREESLPFSLIEHGELLKLSLGSHAYYLQNFGISESDWTSAYFHLYEQILREKVFKDNND